MIYTEVSVLKTVFFTKLAVGKSKVLHNCLKYVPLDCIKNIPHKVSVSSCCLKCSYFPVLRFILRLEPMLNKVPEKSRLEMILMEKRTIMSVYQNKVKGCPKIVCFYNLTVAC